MEDVFFVKYIFNIEGNIKIEEETIEATLLPYSVGNKYHQFLGR